MQVGVGAQVVIKVKDNDVNVTIDHGLVKIKNTELVLGHCGRRSRRGRREKRRGERRRRIEVKGRIERGKMLGKAYNITALTSQH